jgi:hypothetical protein
MQTELFKTISCRAGAWLELWSSCLASTRPRVQIPLLQEKNKNKQSNQKIKNMFVVHLICFAKLTWDPFNIFSLGIILFESIKIRLDCNKCMLTFNMLTI